MSYDLHFYKKKENSVSKNDIRGFLNNNLLPIGNDENEWFFENEDTGVYFSFNYYDPKANEEPSEAIDDFINTGYSFNINFVRPDFFGQEAFEFVDKFINSLDLYILDFQSNIDADNPIQPATGLIYKNWSQLNSSWVKHFSKEQELPYLRLEKSNYAYLYNKERSSVQKKLGDNYFVPKIYFLKTFKDREVITVSTWTQSIPNIFPDVDFYLLVRQKKKFFRTIKETGLINRETLVNNFGNFLTDYNNGCKIIHPAEASLAKEVFSTIKLEHKLEEFAEPLSTDKIVNAS